MSQLREWTRRRGDRPLLPLWEDHRSLSDLELVGLLLDLSSMRTITIHICFISSSIHSFIHLDPVGWSLGDITTDEELVKLYLSLDDTRKSGRRVRGRVICVCVSVAVLLCMCRSQYCCVYKPPSFTFRKEE